MTSRKTYTIIALSEAVGLPETTTRRYLKRFRHYFETENDGGLHPVYTEQAVEVLITISENRKLSHNKLEELLDLKFLKRIEIGPEDSSEEMAVTVPGRSLQELMEQTFDVIDRQQRLLDDNQKLINYLIERDKKRDEEHRLLIADVVDMKTELTDLRHHAAASPPPLDESQQNAQSSPPRRRHFWWPFRKE